MQTRRAIQSRWIQGCPVIFNVDTVVVLHAIKMLHFQQFNNIINNNIYIATKYLNRKAIMLK